MKRKLPFLIFFSSLAISFFAQVPMFFNTNVAGGANTFPLGNTGTSRKVQWFIPPNSLGGVGPGNNITKVYFQTGSAASVTYPILTVKLKTGSGTGLTGVAAGPIEPGMQVVYSGVNVAVTGTVGGWLGITLTTPFLYNPALPLIVELEHNSTIGGPTVYQAANIPGPGNGRQWADYNFPTITGVGTQQVNFGIDVLPAVPCTGIPPTNTVLPLSYTTCPGLINPQMSFASTYTLGGLSYQWYESTVSPVGPWTAIPNATAVTYPTPPTSNNVWYQAVVTCSAGGGTVAVGSGASVGGEVVVGGSVTNTAPYFEGFENVQLNGRMPNCSWSVTSLNACSSYTAAAGNGRVPNNGSKFAAFSNSVAGTNTYYSNGIFLNAGVTYSSGLWYVTEPTGALNWSDISLLVGPNQSTTGLVSFASSNGPAASIIYKSLSGTFTVPSSGLYYIAVSATGGNGAAQYLSWDDLFVSIPCSLNTPTVTINSASTTVCAGTPVNLTASGATSYSWNTGATTSTISPSPNFNTTYIVTGTSTLTGCSMQASQIINVNPSPSLLILANPLVSCAGKPVTLIAAGANQYFWGHGPTTQNITVSPSANTNYSVQGTNNFGCLGSAVITVTVNPLPQVNATPSITICEKETVALSANGASTYKWTSGQIFLIGAQVNVTPIASTIYTVTGTDANGCEGTAITQVNVSQCLGVNKVSGSEEVKVYPNPTSGKITISLANNESAQANVFDISGKLIFTGTVKNNSVIDLSSFSSGIYHVNITTQSSNSTFKIEKE